MVWCVPGPTPVSKLQSKLAAARFVSRDVMRRIGHLRPCRHRIDEKPVIGHGDRLHGVALAIVNVGGELEGAAILDFPAGGRIAAAVQ